MTTNDAGHPLRVAIGEDDVLLREGVARILTDAGLDVVMNRCVKIEHARFAGGLHLAGFNTGVISSRRQSAP